MPGEGGQNLLTDRREQGGVAPGRGGDEVMQRLVQTRHVGRVETRGDRLDTLALTRKQQTGTVANQPVMPICVPQDRGQPG
jgi:hypothetical protein